MKYLILLLELFTVSNVNAEECRDLFNLCMGMRDNYLYCESVEYECKKYCEIGPKQNDRLCELIYRKF